jgi:hypothetical protein
MENAIVSLPLPSFYQNMDENIDERTKRKGPLQNLQRAKT